MLEKFLKEVVVLVLGKQAEELAELLHSKKHINEFNIAKKLNLTINQTRNLLYRISDYGLVSSVRKKDKKKGWYTYFWKFDVLKCLEFLKKGLLIQREELELQINKRKNKAHYYCEGCKVEFDEDQALLMDFTCNECGEVFSVKEDTELVKSLEKEYDKLNEKISLIDNEIEKEAARTEKQKQREIATRDKEKEKKKKDAAEKRREKREKTKKQNVKKKTTKKKLIKKKTAKKKTAKKKTTKKKTMKKKPAKKKTVKKKSVKKKTTKKKSSKKKTKKKK
jgi:transcription factor E